MRPHRHTAIIAAILASLPACGSDHGTVTQVPSTAELHGTYDVLATDRDTGESTRGVGTIRVDGTTVSLALTEPSMAIAGMLRDDGTITLTGQTTGSDIVWLVGLAGKFEVRNGTIHFVGVRTTEVPFPLEVVMERRLDANPQRFAGRYQLRFDASPSGAQCASRLLLDVTMDDVGIATVPGTNETCGPDEVVGRLRDIGFHVAPSGRFQIEATWELADGSCHLFPGGPCLLVVDGTLDADAGRTEASAVLLSGLRTQGWAAAATLERIAR